LEVQVAQVQHKVVLADPVVQLLSALIVQQQAEVLVHIGKVVL
jgi:hypothetical protein